MKKRCTASNCRRLFDTAVIVDNKCPYCGKEYPRITQGNIHSKNSMIRYALILESIGKQDPFLAAWFVSKTTGWDLLRSKDVLKHLPATLAEGLTQDSAVRKKTILEKAGYTVKLKPHHL